jgi:hypothetical protein
MMVSSEWGLVATSDNNEAYVIVKQVQLQRVFLAEDYWISPQIYLILREKFVGKDNITKVKEGWV